jgi:hypothetical protein
MRSSLTAPVTAVLFLLAAWLLMTSRSASSKAVPRQSDSIDSTNVQALGRILGRGLDRDDARKQALPKASKLLDEFLETRSPSVESRPSATFIQNHLLRGENRENDEDQRVSGKNVQCWSWSVVMDAQSWSYLLARDREVRQGERMSMLARILAGLVAALAVIALYIRAEEWTKGYYTGWLRAAAGAALALVASILWWIPHLK